jgi:hypothetical protein
MTQIFYVGQSIIASIRGLNSRFFYSLSICFYCFPSLAAGMMKVFLAYIKPYSAPRARIAAQILSRVGRSEYEVKTVVLREQNLQTI